MKNVLCWFGIIIILALVVFPPVLRLTLPKKTETEKIIETRNYVLACTNPRFIINTSYEDDVVKMIVMKKIYTEQEKDKRKKIDENIENLDEQLLDPDTTTVKYQDIIKIFENIKDKTSITYNVLDDGEVITIDFSVNDHKNLPLEKLNQNMEKQQKYYERLDFSCVIK